MLSARSKALRLAFVRSIAHRIVLIVVTAIPPGPSAAPSLSLADRRRWRLCHTRASMAERHGPTLFIIPGLPRAAPAPTGARRERYRPTAAHPQDTQRAR